MAASLINPNNHVPNVSPEDEWEDAGYYDPDANSPDRILPPKRKTSEAEIVKIAESNDEGLRIECSTQLRQDDPSPGTLEIHEISGDILRLQSDGDATPKPERQVVFQERPLKNILTESDSKEAAWGRAHKKPIRWMILSGIGVVVVVVTGLLLLPMINEFNKISPRKDDLLLTLKTDEATVEGIDAINRMVPLQTQAEQIYRAFASAKVVDEFLPLIRDGKSLEALIRKSFSPAKVSKDWRPDANCIWNVFNADGIPCGLLEGSLPDQSPFHAIFVMKSNRLLLDWKATVGYCTASYAELAESRGDGSEIRGWVIPATFYTATFPEADYQCYQLFSPDNENILWCYARKESQENTNLAPLFPQSVIIESPNEPAKVTISLEHSHPGSLPYQWSIKKVLHHEWVSPK